MKNRQLTKYISPIGAWALSVGGTIGWGLMVVLVNNYLSEAGPIGSVLGLLIGLIIMLIISCNYYYLLKDSNNPGGALSYTREYLGYDHSFLCSWFLILIYLAMFWANLASIPYLLNFFFNNIFRIGFHYTFFGYEVYIGEIILSLTILLLTIFICCNLKKTLIYALIIMCISICVGFAVCFCAGIFNYEAETLSIDPIFIQDKSVISQIIHIAVFSSWAYIGFENISHSAKELNFDKKNTKIILLISLLTSFAIYIFTILLSVSAFPSKYNNWFEYISDIKNLKGVDALPAFYAAKHYLGNLGVLFMSISLMSLIATSLIANIITLSRLFYAMSFDKIIPGRYYRLNKKRIPINAIKLIGLISAIIPFLGRSALGWIVDATTFGAIIIFSMVSGSSLRKAIKNNAYKYKLTGILGIIIMILFALYIILSNLLFESALEPETYFLFAVWAIIGFMYFVHILKHDESRNYGKSPIVWMILLILVLFTSLIWMSETAMNNTDKALFDVKTYILDNKSAASEDINNYIESTLISVRYSNIKVVIVFALLFGFSLNIHLLMQKRQQDLEADKIRAEEENNAKSRFLFNMSHDLRTPMNAILGFSSLAKQDNLTVDERNEYLDKINYSGKHLLKIINDILDMSQLESGKLILMPEPINIRKLFCEATALFKEQMKNKNITYHIDYSKLTNDWIICDANRFQRVIQNLIGNAFKFTPENGEVTVTISNSEILNNKSIYTLTVKDNGIGMSKEFMKNVFSAFERERSSTVSKIQGTGLGLSITKNIIELMNGTIKVNSKQNEGTEFIVTVSFPIADNPESQDSGTDDNPSDSSKNRVLLVDDNNINLEIAYLILTREGYIVECAENGKDALEKISKSAPGYYSIVLMDIQMPVMDGYEATKAIRSLKDSQLSSIPILAMSANSFPEDIQKALDAGMTGHVSKPIDVTQLKGALKKALKTS